MIAYDNKSSISPKSKSKSKEEYEKSHLLKIQKQYSETLNFAGTHIAARAMSFKNNAHSNTFDALMEAWEDYREENGGEEERMDSNDNALPTLPEITRQRSTDDPFTIETMILERHIYEMLYNILLASHYHMKTRKDKLMHELYAFVTAKSKSKKKKKSQIIAKYLPNNTETMKLIMAHIFESIVQKHYYKCKVFTELNKADIMEYIKQSCKLSFKMVIAQNELSFFPLLFTDQSSSYISPVVRYDRVIKKKEKKRGSTLDESSLLQVLKTNRPKPLYIEGKHNLSPLSVKTSQILYYTFPGVIVKAKDKVLNEADVFTYDDPSIFLRHDLNWIFSNNLFRQNKMIKFKKDKSVETEDEASPAVMRSNPLNKPDPYEAIANDIAPKLGNTMDKIQVDPSDVIQQNDFLSKAQLIQDWASLKTQHVDQLCEQLCDLIMEEKEEKQEDDEDEEAAEFEANKMASQLLFALIMKSREEMSQANNANNICFLNMYDLYKHCTNWKGNAQKTDRYLKHGHIVKRIVDKVFEAVVKESHVYKRYVLPKAGDKLKQKLHQYIAKCCQLICNINHHEWDVCPVEFDNANAKSLRHYDEVIHIKENTLSMEESQDVIGYCCFPGIIAKSCWNQFDRLCSKKPIQDQDIKKFLKYRMWTVLVDK